MSSTLPKRLKRGVRSGTPRCPLRRHTATRNPRAVATTASSAKSAAVPVSVCITASTGAYSCYSLLGVRLVTWAMLAGCHQYRCLDCTISAEKCQPYRRVIWQLQTPVPVPVPVPAPVPVPVPNPTTVPVPVPVPVPHVPVQRNLAPVVAVQVESESKNFETSFSLHRLKG
jgi:hypothetical protein